MEPGPAIVDAGGGLYSLVLASDDVGVRVEMQQERQHLEREPAVLDLTPLLGAARPVTELVPVLAGTGLRHLLVPVEGVEDLAALPLRAEDIADLSERLMVDTIGVYAVAQCGERTAEVHMRDLCAGIGATEEAARACAATTPSKISRR